MKIQFKESIINKIKIKNLGIHVLYDDLTWTPTAYVDLDRLDDSDKIDIENDANSFLPDRKKFSYMDANFKIIFKLDQNREAQFVDILMVDNWPANPLSGTKISSWMDQNDIPKYKNVFANKFDTTNVTNTIYYYATQFGDDNITYYTFLYPYPKFLTTLQLKSTPANRIHDFYHTIDESLVTSQDKFNELNQAIKFSQQPGSTNGYSVIVSDSLFDGLRFDNKSDALVFYDECKNKIIPHFANIGSNIFPLEKLKLIEYNIFDGYKPVGIVPKKFSGFKKRPDARQ